MSDTLRRAPVASTPFPLMEQFTEFVGNHLILFGALVVILALLGANLWAGATARGRALSPAEAVRLMNRQDAVVVDVREQREFDRAHIQDAVHVPYSRLPELKGELERYKDRPVILCCTTGSMSTRASADLAKAGFEDLYRLQGGFTAWQQENLPVARSGDD